MGISSIIMGWGQTPLQRKLLAWYCCGMYDDRNCKRYSGGNAGRSYHRCTGLRALHPSVQAPGWLSGEAMLLVQSLLNFLIPSGSGQAVTSIPIMAPCRSVRHLPSGGCSCLPVRRRLVKYSVAFNSYHVPRVAGVKWKNGGSSWFQSSWFCFLRAVLIAAATFNAKQDKRNILKRQSAFYVRNNGLFVNHSF